jgi:hypothetical protein
MTVIYFYHIPKTGGSYVNKYLKNLSKSLNMQYVSFYDTSSIISKENINHYITTLSTIGNKDTIIHHHHGYPGMKFAKIYIEALQQKLKEMNNNLYLITVVRDPVRRTYSGINYNKCINQNAIDNYIKNKSNYIIRYILYNKNYVYNNILDEKEMILFDSIVKMFDYMVDINKISTIRDYLSFILQKKNIIQMPPNKINKTNYIITLKQNDINLINKYNKLDILFYRRFLLKYK